MKIASFQLDFLSQVREGEVLTLFKAKDEEGFRIKGECDGRLAFLAQIKTK